MSEESNYWLRIQKSRVGRRRFLGGAATAGVGAAAFGLVGCGDDDDGGTTATGTTASGTTAAPAATTAAPTTPAVTKQKGGTFRATSANNTWDTFDGDRSRFTPVAYLIGLTNQNIVQWKTYQSAQLEGGLASKWEQPDKQTLVLTLRENSFWHNKPPVNGRAATADDIASFIKRNKASTTTDGTKDTNFYRASAYANVDSVTVTDPKTVTVKFAKPDPFLLNVMAASYAKVQAPEAIKAFEKDYSQLKAEHVIGTGAFLLKDFAAEGKSKWERFDKFYAGTNFDGVEWFPLFTDQTAQQVAFENKQIDIFSPTQIKVVEDLNNRMKGKITHTKVFVANPQAGTYSAGGPPWNDPKKIGAIFMALDRRAMITSVFQSQAALTGNTIPPQAAFGMTEKELITFPGYKEDRAAEEKEARAMWDAAGGPALGDITVDIPDIWEGLYSGGAAVITNQLKKVLGNNFVAKVENYTTISTKVTGAKYGNGNNNIWYGWISDIQDVDPSLSNYLLYNSTQPQWAQFQVKSDKLDALTKQGSEEFDVTKRKEIGKDVDRELARNFGAGIPYTCDTIGNVLTWNYVKFSEVSTFITTHAYGRDWYFDQKDATWAGRPA